ncbi:uroporphyrinogen-III C-methyltransferase [Celerinatantimonas yamalensis]|uniref:Uroporphyrinogen-III C-methyltransferase n=1 Tax=Celerinatantimonas yamalensis TaxID=559956 RepID=A0ABW9GA06_9GAMM
MSESSPQYPPEQAKTGSLKGGLLLSGFALVVSIAIAGYGWQQIHALNQQVSSLNTQNSQLQTNLTKAAMTATKQDAQLREQLSQTQQNLATQRSQNKVILSQLQSDTQALKQRFSQLNLHDLNQWRLYESQYLIHLAARKALLESDMTSAKTLLQSADQSVLQLHDPQYIALRRAIADDINQLDALPKIDIEGIMIQIDSLSQQVTELALTRVTLPKVQDQPTASSQSGWKASLAASWHHFIDQFITVRRRNSDVKPLLAPDKVWYLKQNLQLQLQQAAIAAGQHRQQLYQQSLATATRWINDYFSHNPASAHLVRTLSKLQSESINAATPAQFSSVALIDQAVAKASHPETSEEQK